MGMWERRGKERNGAARSEGLDIRMEDMDSYTHSQTHMSLSCVYCYIHNYIYHFISVK